MFVQDILRKKERLEQLIDRFMLMSDYFELYRFTNEVNEIEHGMTSAAHTLFNRAGGSSQTNEYMLQQAKLLVARARSDRAIIPYDSLGHWQAFLEEGDIPPIHPDREAYPANASKDVRIAYRTRVEDEILAYIDREIDLDEYSLPDAARCLIDATLRRASMSFSEECIADIPETQKRVEKAQRALLDRELGADRYDKPNRPEDTQRAGSTTDQ